MALSIFLILLLACLLFSLVLLWHLGWLHFPSSHSAVASRHSLVHRLLKPRCPDDCPACLLASTPSSSVRPASASVRPWCEVKSRRGAPKRVNTQDYACPNQQCPYFGITDAQIHAPLGRWQAWPGRADPDVPLSGLSYHAHAPVATLPSTV